MKFLVDAQLPWRLAQLLIDADGWASAVAGGIGQGLKGGAQTIVGGLSSGASAVGYVAAGVDLACRAGGR